MPDRVTIGFKAFDLHELLLHFIAVKENYYTQNGLAPQLKDVAFVNDEDLNPSVFVVACGSALLARLRGRPWKVIFAGIDKPLFWIYTRNKFNDISELEGTKIASYSHNTPPGKFLRIILRLRGLNPDSQVTIEPVHDDVSRLGLLKSGQVDASVISSMIPPTKIERMGFRNLACFGDNLRIPTTGLAVHEDMIRENPEQVRKMVGIFRHALEIVKSSPDVAIPAVADLINDSTDVARETYQGIYHHFTRDGKCEDTVLKKAVKLVADELALRNDLDPGLIYDFSL